MRILEALVLVGALEIAWLGHAWATHEPVPVHRRWSLFEPSLGEQGPCWSSGYEVVCCFSPPPAWERPGEVVPVLASRGGL